MSGSNAAAFAEQAAALVAHCLGLPAGEVSLRARLGEPERWDSLGHVAIVAATERAVGRELTTEEILRLDSVQALSELLATATRHDDPDNS
jgi:acyl carrier protein